MPGGGRRLTRVMSPPSSVNKHSLVYPQQNAATTTTTSTPMQTDFESPLMDIKHIRLPPLRRESTLFFEIILLFHVILFNALQFLHLYRTVWWLPQSFNSSGMNFHLVDGNLIVFVLCLLGRRVPYLILKNFLKTNITRFILRICLSLGLIFVLGLSTWRLYHEQNLSIMQVLYLYLPFVFYMHTFGIGLLSFWDMEEIDNPSKFVDRNYHTCTNDPLTIREECEMLRKEFNKRIKSVLCLSAFASYYSCFIPWCFVQPFVYYDLYWVSQHLILSWMFIFGLYISRAFCPEFSDGLHKAACHLGKWARLRPNHVPSNQWSGEYLFIPGAIVKHQRELYKAEGNVCAASEPGNNVHMRFQLLFSGSTFSRLLLGFQLSVLLISMLILTRTIEWYQLISISSMLITSSHTFIRLSRDFLVLWKMYQTEEIINHNSKCE